MGAAPSIGTTLIPLGLHVGQPDVADAVRILADLGGDLFVARHLLRARGVVALLHRELFPIGVGARGSVARVNRNLAAILPTALQSVTSPVKICSTCFLVRSVIGFCCSR